jgi:hypothetical protein
LTARLTATFSSACVLLPVQYVSNVYNYSVACQLAYADTPAYAPQSEHRESTP